MREQGVRGVLVRRTRALQGRFWRHRGAYLAEHESVSLEVMVAVLRCCLCVRFAHSGDLIYEQMRGLPIVGPLSDLGAALVPDVNECRSRSDPSPQLVREFGMLPRGANMSTSLIQVRYVDDLLANSNSLCVTCLTQ